MATTYDSAATSGRARAAGSGIVLAGDRTQNRTRAHRHSMFVRALRVAMPLAAVGVAGLYTVSIMRITGWGKGIPQTGEDAMAWVEWASKNGVDGVKLGAERPDLMAFYFRSTEANDACYQALINREVCRPIAITTKKPEAKA